MLVNIKSIDEYLKSQPDNVVEILQKIRSVVHGEAPKAEEAIRYGMPTFRVSNTNLLHFAAYAHHIGFYPTPSAIEEFSEKLKMYKTSKGAIQFPLDKPIPYDLIKTMTKYRLKQVLEKKTPSYR